MTGLNPATATDINFALGTVCRELIEARDKITRAQTFCAQTDFKLAPYSMTQAQEDALKSAIATANAGLVAIDYTFITRITGLF